MRKEYFFVSATVVYHIYKFLDVNLVFLTNLQPDNRQPVAALIANRFADDTESKVPVKEISLPDLSIPLQLGRREPFSLFIPKHRKLAARLIDIFLGLFPILFTVLHFNRVFYSSKSKNYTNFIREPV